MAREQRRNKFYFMAREVKPYFTVGRGKCIARVCAARRADPIITARYFTVSVSPFWPPIRVRRHKKNPLA